MELLKAGQPEWEHSGCVCHETALAQRSYWVSTWWVAVQQVIVYSHYRGVFFRQQQPATAALQGLTSTYGCTPDQSHANQSFFCINWYLARDKPWGFGWNKNIKGITRRKTLEEQRDFCEVTNSEVQPKSNDAGNVHHFSQGTWYLVNWILKE